MWRFLLILLLSLTAQYVQAQDDNRRAHYYETFHEVTEPIDSIVVYKSKREMICYHNHHKVKKYMISLGEVPVGKKHFEGDMKTPEGLYRIDGRDTASEYHTNLSISYPNAEDRAYAEQYGERPGGEIKIHGMPNNHKGNQKRHFLNSDWTIGCIAVADHEVDELYQWVVYNCPILLLP